jgi:hypothetical protein
MLKDIKKYSVVALATLVMVGCGGSGDGGTATKDLSGYSDAEKLAYALVNQKKALNAGQSDGKKSRAAQACKNGGSMDFGEFDFSNYTDYSSPMTVAFKNCNDGQGVTSGTMKMDLDENEEGTISFLTDFSFKDSDGEGFIKKGGKVEIHYENGWEVATINMVATFNGVTHGGENLIYRSKELPSGEYEEYPVSGKEKIGDSVYFTVDPYYDASTTPFTSNSNDELISGLFKYLDADNHAVELEITAKDVVTVRVDENGDSVFSDAEQSTINLAQ